MAYNTKKNQAVLEGMLDITKRYAAGFPEMWDIYNLPGAIDGLPIISHMRNPDADALTTFVEIRREGGSFKFYDRFDGEAKASSPERIAEKLGLEGTTGWMSSETYTPEYLTERISSKIKEGIDFFINLKLIGKPGKSP